MHIANSSRDDKLSERVKKSSRDDKLSERVKKSRGKKRDPAGD